MESDMKLSLENICRTCMCESSNMTSLFSRTENGESTLSHVLSFISNISVGKEDRLPKQVCEECQIFINKTEAFRNRCLETETKLRELLNNSQKILVDEKLKIKQEIYEVEVCANSSYQCSICLSKFTSLDSINKHQAVCTHDKKDGITFKIIANSGFEEHRYTSNDNCEDIVKEESCDKYMYIYEDTFDSNVELKTENPVIIEDMTYSCLCKSVFHNIEDLKTHMETNNCSKTAKDIKNVGLLGKYKNKLFCQKCNVCFTNAKSYRRHQRRHSNSELYQCSMCMRRFKTKSSLINHIQRHEEKETVNYACTTCKREFKHQAHLDNHILLVHTREKGFKCEICLKSFATKENLDIHKDRHKIKKNHQCKVCFKAFCMVSTLKDHMRTHTGEKPYLCSTCGKSFSQKNNLTQHIKRHQGVKEFKCENCDQRFVSKGELIAHNRKHSGAHPFVCDDCGNGFTTSSSMMKHRRIHTGERPYACDLCPMRFAASGTLKNHRRTHTNERPHQCTFCDKAFVQRNDMIAHVRCHTGDRPFVCNTCGQAFRKTSALKSHIKTHVREQKEMSMLQGVNALLSGMQVEN